MEKQQTKSSGFWKKRGEQMSLKLFHRAARQVPAYKDFLKKHKISSNKIKTYQDFKNLPVINKKNYLRVYSLDKLIWGGNLRKNMVFTSTSGSTGAPVYFPRQEKLDWQNSVFIEQFLSNSSYGSKNPTLVIIGFGMGVWIGGLITYKAFEIAGKNGGYPLSIITPGINKNEIFNALKNISEKAGVKNFLLDTANIYGTADIGAMAWETPLSILVRRLAIDNNELFE